MTPWTTPTADGVRRLNALVDAPVFSPDGALMAFWRTRGADSDLVVRERVHVIEVSSGRELVALDGPDIVRALAFVSADELLVQRDVEGGARLSLHAIPDGGVVAETVFTTGGGMETELQVTADRRKVYSAPVWRTGTRKVAEGVVCSLPELEVLTTLAPFSVAENHAMVDVGYPGRSLIDPEGTRIAVFYNNSPRVGHMVVYPLDAVFSVPRVLPIDMSVYNASIRWLGRDQILFGTRGGMHDFRALALAPAAPSHKLRVEPWASTAVFSAYDGSLDHDAARVVGPGRPANGVTLTSHELTVLDARSGAPLQRLALDNAHLGAHAVAWSADNAHLLLARHEKTDTRVTARALSGLARGEIKVPHTAHAPNDRALVRALSGDAVLLTLLSSAGALQCNFLDPEALGLSRQVLRQGAR